MNNCFIYVIKHPETLEVRYVGQTSVGTKRFQSHIAKRYRKQAISCFIRSLIDNNNSPVFEVIEYCDKDQLDTREIFWIARYKQLGALLLNYTEGGKSNRGFKMPHEVSEMHRQRLKGKPGQNKGKKFSKKAKENISSSAKKRCERLGPAFLGMKHSDKTRSKMRGPRPHISAHNRRAVLCIETNKSYESIRLAAKDLEIPESSIKSVLQGVMKKARGYSFQYLEKNNG